MKKLLFIVGIIVIILLGVWLGTRIFYSSQETNQIQAEQKEEMPENNLEISTIEVGIQAEEKTTPNTLMIYRTYYTKCKHYVQEYEDIDISLVNYTKEELQDKCKGWKVDSFSKYEVGLSKEKEEFCNQHYKLQLGNNVIVVYHIDEDGKETEYEQTGITTEYLTKEDIVKLTKGIFVYGKENLTSTLEDYE